MYRDETIRILLACRKQNLAPVSNMDGYYSYLREHDYLTAGSIFRNGIASGRDLKPPLTLVFANQASVVEAHE
jgi:hypothetical protein